MSNVIPAGQPFKNIDVTVSAGPDGLCCESSDPQLVSCQGGERIEVRAFCRYTRLTLTAGDALFGPDVDPPAGSDSTMRYSAAVTDPDSLRIDIANTNCSREAEPGRRTVAASLAGMGFSIVISTPAYQQVNVAVGDGAFRYSGDIDTSKCPPRITFGRPGATYFTLVGDGVRFANPAFVWEGGKSPDSCIIDQGVDDKDAILTNLHQESDGTEHCFRLQVNERGQTYLSEDPTIVNVTPPPDPENR